MGSDFIAVAKKRARIEESQDTQGVAAQPARSQFVPEQAYTLGRQGGSRTGIFLMSELQPMRTFDPDRRCIVHDGAIDSTFAWNPLDAEHYRRYAEPWDTPGVISYDGALLDGWREA